MWNSAIDKMKTKENRMFRDSLESEIVKYKAEFKDWGHSYLVGNEMAALRIAYMQRNNKNGVKIDACPNNIFMVTVFNSKAKEMGIDTN